MRRLFLLLAMVGAIIAGPAALPAQAAINCTGCSVIGQSFKSGSTIVQFGLSGSINKKVSGQSCQWNTFTVSRQNSNLYLLRVTWKDIDKSSGSSVTRSTGDTGRFSPARTSYSTQPVQIWTGPHVNDAHGRWLTVTITYVDIRDGIERTAVGSIWASNP